MLIVFGSAALAVAMFVLLEIFLIADVVRWIVSLFTG